MRVFVFAFPLLILAAVAVGAIPPTQQTAEPGSNASAEDSARRAVIAGNLKATVWASEPLLMNPVVFTFDARGRCFVAETYRFKAGVPDTRDFMEWLDDDIGARTTDDRLAKYKKYRYPDYTKNSEQLRIIWDSKGTGRADTSDLFATGFNRPLDGVAAGILARGDTVYFACIPELYALGTDGKSSQATTKQSLFSGFGVRDQFVGHDLHGLILGPDGRLYFSIGDRGLNVVTKEGKRLFNPDSGAVLRCEPDGSKLELVHIGLRNPQELAFDDFGNLFTYDNNSDSGDKARWVQIIEGGDSGWRCGYQYGTLMHHAGVPQSNRGPWNTEKIWHVPGAEGQPPAYVVPPLAHFGNGPSGLAYYPGVGLNDRYQNHFFACDFTANARNSFIWSLTVKPKGASFEIDDLHPFVSAAVPTDCEFGPDGAFYWSDWTGGWDLPKKGRIIRVTDDDAMKNPAIAEAKSLLAAGFANRTVDQLLKDLSHPHRQVRLEAQYEFARRDLPAISKLLQLALTGTDLKARLHAIWGIGHYQRTLANVSLGYQKLASDPHPMIRAAFARSLGGSKAEYQKLLRDADPAVRREAALAFGHFKPAGSDDYIPLFTMLKDNANADAYLRHAAAQGLASFTEQPCDLITAFDAAVAQDKSFDAPAVRLGVVLALRKLQCHRIARFLTDADPAVASEAARAIYDQEQMAAMEELAAMAGKPLLPEAIAFRALAANFRLGEPANAARIVAFASRAGEPDHLRVTAMKMLADWKTPPRRDPITGLRLELPARPTDAAGAAVKASLDSLLKGSDALRSATVQALTKLNVEGVGASLLAMVKDVQRPTSVRVECLFAMESLKAGELKDATAVALADKEPRVRGAARVIAAKADPTKAAIELPKLLNDPGTSIPEKQMVLTTLATLRPTNEIDAAFTTWMDKLLAGTVPPEMTLELLEAAQARLNRRGRPAEGLREKLAAYDRKARDGVDKDPLSRWRDVTHGGDAEKGKEIFLNNAAVYCQRCHKLAGQGGEVGPELTTIAKEKTRDYLLDSIVNPNAAIAKGFESVILTLADGRKISGVLRSKSATEVVLVDAEGKVTKVHPNDIEEQRPDKSAMPDDLSKKLSRRELRDVVEFLASLK